MLGWFKMEKFLLSRSHPGSTLQRGFYSAGLGLRSAREASGASAPVASQSRGASCLQRVLFAQSVTGQSPAPRRSFWYRHALTIE